MSVTPSVAVFFTGLLTYLIIRARFQRGLARADKTVNASSPGDKALVGLVGAAQVMLPLVHALTPVLDRADYALPAQAPWLGSLLMASGVWLFWRSHADLGRNWSVTLELERNHHLVTRGVYRRIRHPMYASFFLMALAQAALLPNAVAGWAAVIAVTLLYVVRKPREEAMMLRHFGEAYASYMSRTGGVVPRIGSRPHAR